MRFLPRLLLVCGLALSSTPPALAAPEHEEKSRELESINQRIGDLSGKLKDSRRSHEDVQGKLREAELRVGRLSRQLRNIKALLLDKRNRLDELEAEAAQLQASLALQRQVLARQIRTAYLMGRQDTMKILLNQEDPARLARVLTYHRYFNQARADQIAGLHASLERIAQLTRGIALETRALADLKDRQSENLLALKQTRTQRAQVLRELDRRIAATGKELHQLNRNKKRLQDLIESLKRSFSDIPKDLDEIPSLHKLRGKLRWPSRGRLLHRFGTSRRQGNLSWQGVLIDAPAGTAVRAVSHGRVAFANWLRGLGLLLIIDHGHGYMSLYGHNQGLFKEVGDWVSTGDVIAAVGDSGGQSRPGLYFEIRSQGVPKNPKRWCALPALTRSARLSKP